MLIEYADFEKELVCLPYERRYLFLPMLHGELMIKPRYQKARITF